MASVDVAAPSEWAAGMLSGLKPISAVIVTEAARAVLQEATATRFRMLSVRFPLGQLIDGTVKVRAPRHYAVVLVDEAGRSVMLHATNVTRYRVQREPELQQQLQALGLPVPVRDDCTDAIGVLLAEQPRLQDTVVMREGTCQLSERGLRLWATPEMYVCVKSCIEFMNKFTADFNDTELLEHGIKDAPSTVDRVRAMAVPTPTFRAQVGRGLRMRCSAVTLCVANWMRLSQAQQLLDTTELDPATMPAGSSGTATKVTQLVGVLYSGGNMLWMAVSPPDESKLSELLGAIDALAVPDGQVECPASWWASACDKMQGVADYFSPTAHPPPPNCENTMDAVKTELKQMATAAVQEARANSIMKSFACTALTTTMQLYSIWSLATALGTESYGFQVDKKQLEQLLLRAEQLSVHVEEALDAAARAATTAGVTGRTGVVLAALGVVRPASTPEVLVHMMSLVTQVQQHQEHLDAALAELNAASHSVQQARIAVVQLLARLDGMHARFQQRDVTVGDLRQQFLTSMGMGAFQSLTVLLQLRELHSMGRLNSAGGVFGSVLLAVNVGITIFSGYKAMEATACLVEIGKAITEVTLYTAIATHEGRQLLDNDKQLHVLVKDVAEHKRLLTTALKTAMAAMVPSVPIA
jgi:hypothetical protein